MQELSWIVTEVRMHMKKLKMDQGCRRQRVRGLEFIGARFSPKLITLVP